MNLAGLAVAPIYFQMNTYLLHPAVKGWSMTPVKLPLFAGVSLSH